MAEDIRNMASTIGKKSFEVKFDQPHCVVLDSAYCSMGRMIGNKACEKSGYTYFDAVILLEQADTKYTKEDVDRIENKYRTRQYTREEMQNDTELMDMLKTFQDIIQDVLKGGPCLIHDRTTKELVEALGYSCISVFTSTNNHEYQIERAKASPLYKDIENDEEVLKKIAEENMIRTNIHHVLSDTPWGQTETYDVILNSDLLGRDYCAEVLAHIMKAE